MILWISYSQHLWTRLPSVDEFVIQNGMNDYAQILYNKHRLVPQNINDVFERNLAFIKKSVIKSDAEKIVIVTHHLPTFASIEDRLKGSVLSDAYATELGNYIADTRISTWVYGHSHHHTDLMIGNTHLVSNPLGYVFCGERTNFNDSVVIEV